MKKLSVVIPIYNAEKTLCRCVDSVLRQTFSDFEVVLVDDGSTDASLDICHEYAKKDDRVVVLHKENAGLVAARKSGVRISSGEYIGFVDSDDYIEADMYSSLMSNIAITQADIAIGGITFDYNDYSKTTCNRLAAGYYNRHDIEETVIPNILMSDGFYKFGIIPGVVVKVFDKKLLEKSMSRVWDGLTIGEDVAITSFAVTLAQSISIIEATSYHYVQTENSMIRSYDPKRFEQICKLYKCISQIDESSYKKQTGACFASLLYGALAGCAKNKNLEKKEIIKMMRSMIENEVSINALENADVSKWEWKDKLKVYLMKRKLINILYIILAR